MSMQAIGIASLACTGAKGGHDMKYLSILGMLWGWADFQAA
jgi:hypothetical protein